MRIALVDPAAARSSAGELRDGLRRAGQEVDLVELAQEPRAPRRRDAGARVDQLLRRRGFDTPLTGLAGLLAELLRGRYDLAHLLSVPPVAAALAWRRVTGRPVVFTCVEPVTRPTLADRRLKLRLVQAAFERSDAVTVTGVEAQAAARRWLALDLPLIGPDDAAGYVELYRAIIARRGG